MKWEFLPPKFQNFLPLPRSESREGWGEGFPQAWVFAFLALDIQLGGFGNGLRAAVDVKLAEDIARVNLDSANR